jgi:hypothetical protein
MRIAVDQRADALRNGGVEQIRTDSRYRVNAEQQYQERRHQRTPTDPRHSDKGADAEAGQRIDRQHRMRAPTAHKASRCRVFGHAGGPAHLRSFGVQGIRG